MTEELLPKPQTDLPLPEKEIPAHTTPASQGLALQGYGRKLPLPKYFLLGIVFVILLTIVVGAYLLGKDSAPKEVAITPTITPEVTASQDVTNLNPTDTPVNPATVGWKVATDATHNIYYSFPADWTTVDPYPGSPGSADRIGFIPISKNKSGSNPPIYALFFENPNNLALQKWEEARDSQGGMSRHFYAATAKTTTINDQTAYIDEKHGCEPVLCKQVVIMGDKRIWVFYNLDYSDMGYTKSEIEIYKPIFENIISSVNK